MSKPAMTEDTMVFHVDMDSFFSSIEQRDHPEFQKRPLVVGADPKQGLGRGVVSTCSYEARKYGIHSAMPISHAYKLCPHAVFVRPDHQLYSQVSNAIMDVIGNMVVSFEQVSIDEAYFEMGHADFDRARDIAAAVKAAVFRSQHLTCSVGVGPSRPVAKIASDMNKPDGITIVRPDTLRQMLDPLPVSRIPGIGKKTIARYHELGIETIGILARYDRKALMERLGAHGCDSQDIARGLDPRSDARSQGSRSISRETTFATDTCDRACLEQALDRQCRRVHSDLMEEPYWFRTVTLKVRDAGYNTFTRARSLSNPSRSLNDIRGPTFALFNDNWDGGKVRLLGVRLSGLYAHDRTQTTLDRWMPRQD